jgi:hypothetical protein
MNTPGVKTQSKARAGHQKLLGEESEMKTETPRAKINMRVKLLGRLAVGAILITATAFIYQELQGNAGSPHPTEEMEVFAPVELEQPMALAGPYQVPAAVEAIEESVMPGHYREAQVTDEADPSEGESVSRVQNEYYMIEELEEALEAHEELEQPMALVGPYQVPAAVEAMEETVLPGHYRGTYVTDVTGPSGGKPVSSVQNEYYMIEELEEALELRAFEVSSDEAHLR